MGGTRRVVAPTRASGLARVRGEGDTHTSHRALEPPEQDERASLTQELRERFRISSKPPNAFGRRGRVVIFVGPI